MTLFILAGVLVVVLIAGLYFAFSGSDAPDASEYTPIGEPFVEPILTPVAIPKEDIEAQVEETAAAVQVEEAAAVVEDPSALQKKKSNSLMSQVKRSKSFKAISGIMKPN